MCRMFSPASTEGDATTLTAMNPEEEHTALNGTSDEWNIISHCVWYPAVAAVMIESNTGTAVKMAAFAI